jgi:hypothetical protein
MPWYLGNSKSFGFWGNPGFVIPLAVWSAVWTGLALWHAARRQEKWWFILFFLVHTAGIAEMLYLLLVVRLFSTKKKKR